MLALTHLPSPALGVGLRTHIGRLPIDHERAARQHADYCRMVERCGARVRTVDVNRAHPDGVFIEDTAVVLDEVAILACMGAPERRGEPAAIEPELRKHREVRRLEAPATLEGGDVLRVGRSLLVGLSSRTNEAGLRALEEIASPMGYRVVPVPVHGCLHLKTACCALPDQSLLVHPAWIDPLALRGFEQIPVPDEEPWAANILLVGRTVCLAAEHPRTADLVRKRGHPVEAVQLSEFAKAEGGVTCLSILIADCPGPGSPSWNPASPPE